jgi:V8-like Glu-specific endopeptidase
MSDDDAEIEVGGDAVPIRFPVFTGRSVFEFAASVVPVLETRSGVTSGCGTAFLISELGLFLTAGHVVNGEFSHDIEAGDYKGKAGNVFFILVPGGDGAKERGHLVGVTIDQIVFEPRSSDVAILKVDMRKIPPGTRRHMMPWPLAHFKPTVDEKCVVAGYADMRTDVPVDEKGISEPGSWTHTMTFDEGPVLALNPNGKDRLLAPYPCFDVAIATSGGMSGGPVFTEKGLVGVISRGWTGFDQSTVALISSCYHLGVDLDIGDGEMTHSITDLIKSKDVLASGPKVQMRVVELGNDDTRLQVEWPDS